MSVKVDIKYNDNIIDSLTNTGIIEYATANKHLSNNLKIDFTGTEDATADATKIVKGYTAYISDGTKVEGIIEEWDGSSCIVVYKPVRLNPTRGYRGSEITNGYICPTGVTMTGNDRGTEIGVYVATYTPNNGYEWEDGTSNSITVTLEIKYVQSYLTFWSSNSFIVGCYNSDTSSFIKGWDGTMEYSTNTTTWNTWDGTSAIFSALNSSDNKYYLYIRGTNNTYVTNQSGNVVWPLYKSDFSALCPDMHCTGNIETLLDYNTVLSCEHPSIKDRAFSSMFYGMTNLIEAPELHSTTLTDSCYQYMFYGCTSLITVPALHATTLARDCCYYMFANCTSLTTAPELPATTLNIQCYAHMFSGCTSLTTAPALPATKLSSRCYSTMFNECTSLTTAPALPATTLADYCYSNMFIGCSKLTTAPALPATTLAYGCYYYMFANCDSLTTAPELPATTLETCCYASMFYACTSLITVPALPATKLGTDSYKEMFKSCTRLSVEDSSTPGQTTEWRIPSSGTFENALTQSYMFKGCRGTRASDSLVPVVGGYSIYYTRSTPGPG